LTKGGEQQDGRYIRTDDLFSGTDAIKNGHLHVQDDKVRAQFVRQLHRTSAVASLTDNVKASARKHLNEVHPNEGFILCDNDSSRGAVIG
jgi:hypothetical protein